MGATRRIKTKRRTRYVDLHRSYEQYLTRIFKLSTETTIKFVRTLLRRSTYKTPNLPRTQKTFPVWGDTIALNAQNGSKTSTTSSPIAREKIIREGNLVGRNNLMAAGIFAHLKPLPQTTNPERRTPFAEDRRSSCGIGRRQRQTGADADGYG